MRVEALKYKGENGNTITVYVNILDYHTRMVFRIDDVEVKPYRKRNGLSISDSVSGSYDYRELDSEGREKYMLARFLEWITPEQAKQAIDNAYALIKPDTSFIDELVADRMK